MTNSPTTGEAATLTRPAPVTLREFDEIFEAVKNWGRWGPDDELGTLNYITRDTVRAAAALVRSGRRATMAIPMNTVAGPDNPSPVIRHVVQGHDIDIGSSSVTFATDFVGLAFHGDCHTHMDALCHIAYQGCVYNGRPAQEVMTSRGATALDVTTYSDGLVGRGVLLDVPRFRGVKWLEPGEAVTRAEIQAIEQAQGVRIGEGDILVFRTGHHRRRLELGAWNNEYPPAGEGKAGLHVDTIPWLHERRIAAFLPDGDGETVPSNVEGILYPVHPLQVTAMGMFASDSLQLEDVARACTAEGRFDFMVVGLPLRLPGATGSPWNPIAISGMRSCWEEPVMERRFEGKVALVTGATTGIGQATAVRLAAEGAIVAVNQHPAADPAETLRRISETGGQGFPVVADMRDPGQVTAMVRAVAERAGRLDHVVSNAAINPFMKWDETSVEDFNALFETNVRGTWVVCTEGAKQMIREGHGGAICCVSSISAHVGAAGETAYCGTKGAISMLAKALGCDLGAHGIRVNAVEPGWTRTNMSAPLMEDPDAVKYYTDRVAIHRAAEPAELAAAIAFTLCADASYMTCATMLVDGGFIVNAEL